MTYETVVSEMVVRFPELQEDAAGGEGMPGVAMGALLLPRLESGDLKTILTVCAFLEDLAESADEDWRLRRLLKAEVGRWMEETRRPERVMPWMGVETKRYVEAVVVKRREESVWGRVKGWLGI
jgi:hypothetical protein